VIAYLNSKIACDREILSRKYGVKVMQ